jgi:hypothetical protein
MKYLKNYNESKSSSEMKLNIKNMFIYFMIIQIFYISGKIKDSDLDTYKNQYSALNVLTIM